MTFSKRIILTQLAIAAYTQTRMSTTPRFRKSHYELIKESHFPLLVNCYLPSDVGIYLFCCLFSPGTMPIVNQFVLLKLPWKLCPAIYLFWTLAPSRPRIYFHTRERRHASTSCLEQRRDYLEQIRAKFEPPSGTPIEIATTSARNIFTVFI
jgi:hypothetical protein